MTRIEMARKGFITEEMRSVALAESISAERLASDIAEGVTVISRNVLREITPLGIGRRLRTKINANIGTSKDRISYDEEMEKLQALVKYGADAVMDLSTGGAIKALRNALIERSPVAVGTVPIYEAVVKTTEKHGHIVKMSADELFSVIEEHAEEGVDFITVHCGVTRKAIERLKEDGRILDVVSRGGAFLLEWMIYNDKENP
ncbi:MAG: phosphomethylpyrimidine synthase ThiC, partial [Nitrospirae bacterium]|nr:phosphomethylpyrimidine synthase ThiC [Nitrospirota bacterium]